MKLPDKKLLIAVGAGALFLWHMKNKATKAVQAINPVNPENVFYEGVNSVGESLTGDDGFSLGSWIYDVTHPNEAEQWK